MNEIVYRIAKSQYLSAVGDVCDDAIHWDGNEPVLCDHVDRETWDHFTAAARRLYGPDDD